MTPQPPPQPFALRVNAWFFYGWVMLAVGALGLFASGVAQSFTFSVFVLPISEKLGLSHTSVSSAYALGTLVAAFGLTYLGRLIDRFGVRAVMAGVALLLGLSAMGFSAVVNLATLFVGFTALRFLGQGSLMLTCNNLVAQWFARRRGFALSLMALGFSASMAVFPPATQWLLRQVGWRDTWLWLGVITWLLVLPPVLLLVRDRPEDIGLRPDGLPPRDAPARSERESAGPDTPGAAGARDAGSRDAAAEAEAGLALGEAVRTPVFWVVALAAANASMLVTGLAFHQISIFENQGLTAQMAANIFPITAATMVLAMPLWGHLLDRLPTRFLLSGGQFLLAAAMGVVLLTDDAATAVVYSVVFGVFNASMMANNNYVWPAYFGRRYLGSVQGAAKTVGILGASLGPLPFGLAFDLLGGYHEALMVLSLLPLGFGVAVLFAHPPLAKRSASDAAGTSRAVAADEG